MKKLRLFSLFTLIGLCLISFTACSDDDDDDVSSDDIANNIIGTWETTHVAGYWYDYTEDENIISIDEDVDEEDRVRLTFNANGTCQYYYYISTWDEWYRESGSYTYNIMGDKIVICDSKGEVEDTFKVLSVNSTQAVIEGTLDEGDSYTFRITLKKVDEDPS
ncbi:MAG: hypothetical protein ACOYJG_12125 [Prevotella sp.]|jgi:hypothetical protein